MNRKNSNYKGDMDEAVRLIEKGLDILMDINSESRETAAAFEFDEDKSERDKMFLEKASKWSQRGSKGTVPDNRTSGGLYAKAEKSISVKTSDGSPAGGYDYRDHSSGKAGHAQNHPLGKVVFWHQVPFSKNGENLFSVNIPQSGGESLSYTFPDNVQCNMTLYNNAYNLNVALPAQAMNADGILFVNFDDPSQTLDEYVEKLAQEKYKKLLEEEQRKKKQREAEQKKLEEEKQQKLEEEKRIAQQARIAEMNRRMSMETVFEKVSQLRQKSAPYYCNFDENTGKFNYTAFGSAPYILYTNEKNQHIVLPNQNSVFNTGNLSYAVYRCNEPLVDESLRMVQPCIVDDNLKIIQRGRIEG